MKIRTGFVSNSSSSSFILKDKNNWDKVINLIKESCEDYYIFKDTLYTSYIGDCSDYYTNIGNLADEEIAGGHGYPYCEDEFVELDGVRGVESVWIPKEALSESDYIELKLAPPILSNKMYFMLDSFFKNFRNKNTSDGTLLLSELYDLWSEFNVEDCDEG